MKKNKRIKARKIWNRNPKEQIRPDRKKEVKKFDDNIFRNQKITSEDLENLDCE